MAGIDEKYPQGEKFLPREGYGEIHVWGRGGVSTCTCARNDAACDVQVGDTSSQGWSTAEITWASIRRSHRVQSKRSPTFCSLVLTKSSPSLQGMNTLAERQCS